MERLGAHRREAAKGEAEGAGPQAQLRASPSRSMRRGRRISCKARAAAAAALCEVESCGWA